MHYDTGDTAWVLTSSAAVLFMTPGLAFFYAGMVRRKNVLAMLMQNYVTMAVVGLLWVWVTYSLAFGPDWGGAGLLGTLHFAGLGHLTQAVPGFSGRTAMTIPPVVFIAFQMMFAVITAALLSGSVAERMKFSAWVVFIAVWSIVVYAPIAHWVFSPNGWLAVRGTEDFAGGTVVEATSGMSGAALALILGRRAGWPRQMVRPHNVPFTVLGAGILWFGWFGFNAGSALRAADAGQAFINTNTATAAALLMWLVVERIRTGKPTTLGAATGAIAGAVAITPACGFVNTLGATVIGAFAGVLCALAVGVKNRLRLDDSLDVLAVHFVAGATGMILLGFFGTASVLGRNGLLYGGGGALLGYQALAVVTVSAYAFGATALVALIIKAAIGLRVSDDDELIGLDLSQHEETAYDFDSAGGALRTTGHGSTRRGAAP
ncbi:MAG: ammonium transporter [Actinomycetota bacterium]|nr:ammonium transporter [Actinomycetota bacterium]